jgi:hypothetical protein
MYAYYRKTEAYYILLLIHILCLFTSVYITQNSRLYQHVLCWQFIKNIWNTNGIVSLGGGGSDDENFKSNNEKIIIMAMIVMMISN